MRDVEVVSEVGEVKTIDQWSTWKSPFEAPEVGNPCIQGVCEAKAIRTSRVVSFRGRIVTTRSGSQYELGEPDELFIEWLKENGYPFDPENPLRLVDKPTEMEPPKAQSILRPKEGT